MDFKGTVFFITGAAKGIGRALAFAVLERGSKVFITDVNEDALTATAKEFQEKFGAENVSLKSFDVTNRETFNEAFKEAVSTFGQIDVMVNNAGMVNEADWERMVKVNFIGVITGTKLAQEHMETDKGGKGGRIINMCSIAGLRDSISTPIYNGTKHAIRSFTSGFALQQHVKDTGIEFGLLCPMVVDTDLIKNINESTISFYKESIANIKSIEVPISEVVEGFLDLVTLPKLNGAILSIEVGKKQYNRMQQVNVDPPSVDEQPCTASYQ